MVFLVVSAIELLSMIGIIAAVTWQVVIVASLITVAAIYFQVESKFQFLDFFNLSYFTDRIKVRTYSIG